MVIKSTTIVSSTWLLFEARCRGFAVSVSLKPWRRTNCCDHLVSVTLWRYPWGGRTRRSARRLRTPLVARRKS